LTMAPSVVAEGLRLILSDAPCRAAPPMTEAGTLELRMVGVRNKAI
jgi:hypothetical protein